VDAAIRIERDRAHEFIGPLVDAFGSEIRSVQFSRPTLHDVFVKCTGHGFD
jgi:hypothetical protein